VEILEDRLAPATITVTTIADDNVANDLSVSLREAIQAINNGGPGGDADIVNTGAMYGTNDTINFNISPSGTVQTINVGGTGNGALPLLAKPMTINGYSEMGASMNTLATGDNAKILIELNGSNAGPNADGLLIFGTGAGSTIEGLAINRFSLNGIELQGGGDMIQGNFVGTNAGGTAALPNQNDGIHISNSSSSTIGGLTPAARNIASGNQIDGIHIVGSTAAPATGNLIQGNFVGVNATGTGSAGTKTVGAFAGTPGGNSVFGIEISGGNGNTVGGATAAARNVVGFNAAGIEIDNGGQGNVVQGNYSGVGADGVTAVGNNLHGIVLRSDDNLSPPLGPGQNNEPAVSGNVIGLNPNTNFSGLGNLVEFNGSAGIAVFDNPPPNNTTPLQNSGNSILGNAVFQNGRSNPTSEIGIDLSNGFVFPKDDGVTPNDSQGHGTFNDPNNFQNFPVLSSVTLVTGGVQISGTFTETVEPNVMLRIEFYVSNPDPLGGIAEGQTFLGATNVMTNASGQASFSMTFTGTFTGGQVITATATNLTADPSAQAGAVNTFSTSEFSSAVAVPNPLPALTSLSPSTVVAGGAGFTLMVTGSNFLSSSVVQLNGTALTTTFVSATQLQVAVPASAIATAGTASITVFTPAPGGGTSNALNLTITGTVPVFSFIAIAADAGGGPMVTVYNSATNAVVSVFFAFTPSFTGGVRVAVDDVNGDGVPDIICAAGPGGGPQVEVIDGTKLTQLQSNGQIANSALIASFFAFNAPTFTGGVYVAAGAASSGQNWVVVGAGAGGSSEVTVYTARAIVTAGMTGAPPVSIANFFAFAPGFMGGVTVAVGDTAGTGKLNVICGAGPGGGPQVIVVNGSTFGSSFTTQSNGQVLNSSLLADFFAFAPSFTGGVFVSGGLFGGQFNLIIGAGAGTGSQVIAINGSQLTQLQSSGQIANSALLDSFFALPTSFLGGARVGFNGAFVSSGRSAILTAAGPGGTPQVNVFDALSQKSLAAFFFLPLGFTGGAFVSG
jgi:CSLREA domain-containing protein